jgi:hypothetical protein
MFQRANALRRIAAGGTIGRLAFLRRYEIDAGAGGKAASATQCLGGDAAVGSAIAGQGALFVAAGNARYRQLAIPVLMEVTPCCIQLPKTPTIPESSAGGAGADAGGSLGGLGGSARVCATAMPARSTSPEPAIAAAINA